MREDGDEAAFHLVNPQVILRRTLTESVVEVVCDAGIFNGVFFQNRRGRPPCLVIGTVRNGPLVGLTDKAHANKYVFNGVLLVSRRSVHVLSSQRLEAIIRFTRVDHTSQNLRVVNLLIQNLIKAYHPCCYQHQNIERRIVEDESISLQNGRAKLVLLVRNIIIFAEREVIQPIPVVVTDRCQEWPVLAVPLETRCLGIQGNSVAHVLKILGPTLGTRYIRHMVYSRFIAHQDPLSVGCGVEKLGGRAEARPPVGGSH